MSKDIVSVAQVKNDLISAMLRRKCLTVGSQTVLSGGRIRTRVRSSEYEARYTR